MSTDASTIEQAYRFALAPTPAQAELLNAWAGASRFWFNQALSEVKARLDRRAAGEDVSAPWSYHDLCKTFNADWRAERAPWQRAEGVCGSYMAAFEGLGAGLQSFSKAKREGRKVGFPDYRRKGRCAERILFQHARALDARHVHIDPRLGPVRSKERLSKLLRRLERDPRARVLRASVKREHSTWYISFTVRRSPKTRRARCPDAVVGGDVGLTRAMTTSTGRYYANGRSLALALRKLRRLQRSLDRQRRAANPGNYNPDGTAIAGRREWLKSNRMLVTERSIAGLHARVANVRRAQAHHLTTALTREFGVIGAESIATKNLMQNKRLSRHIADVGWGIILAQLAYKAKWAGSIFHQAGRFYPSSKTCSACGVVKAKLDLRERVFVCDTPGCGWVCDRDLNAAHNLATVAKAHAESEGRTGLYVARIGRLTLIARGGHVSPGVKSGQSPLPELSSAKREGPVLRHPIVETRWLSQLNHPQMRQEGPS